MAAEIVPSSEVTFGALLRARAVVFGLVDGRGAADAAKVATFLSRRTPVTPRAVESWFWGERAPRIGRMEVILDELGVHGDDRLLAYRLAALVEQDRPSDHEPSSADPAATS